MKPPAAERGRVNQKRRTREAIVAACRDLIDTGAEISMPAVAHAALMSEATAYRYFPDLISLLREAYVRTWPDATVAMKPMQDNCDPVERVAYATELLMRSVLKHQGAARAVISASITRPNPASIRPGFRFELIDHALAPLTATEPTPDAATLTQLKLDLAVILGAETLFTLIDLCKLTPEQAITSAVHTARIVTHNATQAVEARGDSGEAR